jgi:hypothetical protein
MRSGGEGQARSRLSIRLKVEAYGVMIGEFIDFAIMYVCTQLQPVQTAIDTDSQWNSVPRELNPR